MSSKDKKYWKLPKIEFHETAAIQALNRGEATPEQQQAALKCIIEKISGYYDEPFCPDNASVTSYHCGRRSVATLTLKEIAIDLQKLKQRNNK